MTNTTIWLVMDGCTSEPGEVVVAYINKEDALEHMKALVERNIKVDNDYVIDDIRLVQVQGVELKEKFVKEPK